MKILLLGLFLSCLLSYDSFSQKVTYKDSVIKTGWYYVVDSGGYKKQLDKSGDYYFINPLPIVSAKNIINLKIYHIGDDHYGLYMSLDHEGTKAWSLATEISIGKQLAFFIDNKLLEVSNINSKITLGQTALNRYDYSKEELENFEKIIKGESD